MTSTSALQPEWRRPWWLWPLLPFVFVAMMIGILFVLLLGAVVAPFAVFASWRSRKQARRLLVREGRYIDLDGAKARYTKGNFQFVVELTKNNKNVWLVPVSADDLEEFKILPTYRQFEFNPRETWGSLTSIHHGTMSKLAPGLGKAIRVQTSVDALVDGSDELKDVVRIVHVLQIDSPSALLYERLRGK